MSLWSSLTGRAPVVQEEAPAVRTISMAELMDEYNLEYIEDTPGKEFAIVTPISDRFRSEIGSSAPSPWTSFTRQEYNPLLQGTRGLEIYDKMRKSDGTIRGSLRLLKTPVHAGEWYMEPRPDNVLSEEQAKFAWCNLTEWMTIGWHQVLVEALLFADFGYYMFEKVWENRIIDGQMRTVLSKLAPRHPLDVESWILDSHGGPLAVRMYTDVNELYPDGTLEIPIEKLLVFTFDREAGNIEGVSALRSAYKHWYYKDQLYKIDAIQKERHGIGIPIVKLPLGFQDEDKIAASNLARNIRTNEAAHAVLPPGWDILMLKLEGQPVDCMVSIEHHNEAIRENILVNFVGQSTREEDLTIFHKASRFVADIVAETFNLYLIPEMVRYNWPLEEYPPQLRVRRIGETADWRTLTFAIRNLIGAGVIIPDERLEENLRQQMDLPAIDKSSARLIATPQNPYDINEDVAQADPNDPYSQDKGSKPSDQRVGEGDATDPVHNSKNPQYNRNRRKLKKPGRKQSGQIAGLPRQTTVSGARNSFGLPAQHGGSERSGGK